VPEPEPDHSPEYKLDVVRQALDAMRAGDMRKVLSFIHPEFTALFSWSPSPGTPVRGKAGLVAWLRENSERWGEYRPRANSIQSVGDSVLVLGSVSALGRDGSGSVRDVAWLCGFQDGKVSSVVAYDSHGEGLVAARQAARAALS
jgi:ketosteroid isomerase-like protein